MKEDRREKQGMMGINYYEEDRKKEDGEMKAERGTFAYPLCLFWII